jgi:hypothetical protein
MACRCELVFGDTIAGLSETTRGVDVTFKKAAPRSFDLVLGCDGLRSNVRRLWLGEETRYMHFLRQYFSITIVDKLLIERATAQMFDVPGKAVMLNAYKNKTDIIRGFFAEAEIPYDYRDEAQQRRIIGEHTRSSGYAYGDQPGSAAACFSHSASCASSTSSPSRMSR